MKSPERRNTINRFAKRATTALVLAGTTLLLCSNPPKISKGTVTKPPASAPAVQTSGQDMDDGARRRAFAAFKEIETQRQNSKTQRAVGALLRLADQISYNSLDCKLVLREGSGPADGVRDKETGRSNEGENAANPVTHLFTDAQKEFLDMHAVIAEFTRKIPNFVRTGMSDEIDALMQEGNLEGLVAVLGYMNSLNLVGNGEGILAESLFGEYSMMEYEAKAKGWEMSPDPECIQRNAEALWLLSHSEKALGALIARNPDAAESILNEMGYRQRFIVLTIVAEELFDQGQPGAGEIENFMSSLSQENKEMFLTSFVIFPVSRIAGPKDTARLAELGKTAKDPDLQRLLSTGDFFLEADPSEQENSVGDSEKLDDSESED